MIHLQDFSVRGEKMSQLSCTRAVWCWMAHAAVCQSGSLSQGTVYVWLNESTFVLTRKSLIDLDKKEWIWRCAAQ